MRTAKERSIYTLLKRDGWLAGGGANWNLFPRNYGEFQNCKSSTRLVETRVLQTYSNSASAGVGRRGQPINFIFNYNGNYFLSASRHTKENWDQWNGNNYPAGERYMSTAANATAAARRSVVQCCQRKRKNSPDQWFFGDPSTDLILPRLSGEHYIFQ